MVMSPGTYTFLTCFTGFWLVWALVVMLCCFCSFVQRKLRRQREEPSLHALEMDFLQSRGHAAREPPQFRSPQALPAQPQAPHHVPDGSWSCPREADVFGKPPSYEDAVQMEDPPPPYSEVLADSRCGTYTKPEARLSREKQDTEVSKMSPDDTFSERTFSSLIHLPVAESWDSLGRLLSTMDLNHNNLSSPAMPPMPGPRDRQNQAELRLSIPLLDRTSNLPSAFFGFGRSTAV